MRLTLPFAALLCLPQMLLAQTDLAPRTGPLTGTQFETYATGKTLTYARGGLIWGTEQYLPGRVVVWAFTEDICQRGYWYEEGEEICFVYELESDAQCWLFYLHSGSLMAQHRDDADGLPLSEVAQSDGPMPCAGPDVGV